MIHELWMQAALTPFLTGFVVALLLFKLRLGGLAVVAGFGATAWLMGLLDLSSHTARHRVVQLALAAPALGLVADFAFRAGRMTAYVLGALFGGAALWAFGGTVLQKPPVQAFIVGGGLVLFVAWTVAFTASLHANSVRSGAAALGLGLGAGFAASFSAGGPFSPLGMAIGAAAGGFLLLQMLLGQRIDAGLVFSLAAGVTGALVAAAALALGTLGWMPLVILAAVPIAARLPLPGRWPVWAQSILASLYATACGGAAAAAAHVASRGWPSWLK